MMSGAPMALVFRGQDRKGNWKVAIEPAEVVR